jgi:uncharacterized surface protein with fasciclin (FAS1) repeats
MNLTISKTRYKLLLFTACISLACLASCKKVEEPTRPIGKPLPYVNTQRKLATIMDSIQNVPMFKAAFKRSTLQTYIDSLNGRNPDIPYTFFIPSDQAFIKAGYTTARLNSMPVSELNDLLGYMIMRGFIDYDDGVPLRSVTYPVLVHPDPTLVRTGPPQFFDGYPYYYGLTVGFDNKTLLLNSKRVKENAMGIRGENGAVFIVDEIVTKPTQELREIMDADTSLTFYLAASKRSQEIYIQKNILGYSGFNFQFNALDWMYLNNNYFDSGQGAIPFAVVFAPVNNAFRKAGFHTIAELEAYIDRSALVDQPENTYMLTNIDSVLVNHRFLSGYSRINNNWSYLYTPDLLKTGTLDNGANAGVIKLQNDNGTVVLHRQDAPNGRAARVVPTYDIIALNGVLHHVDNLMLTTP